ncbi:TPA: type II toxin-antitoxin system RelE/ParE family toxin [Mannheimia haemolytica]|uniref:Plasmid stabilisation system protein n=1 Tax=Mannheimia haemolytica TaxID=75985 RepID=A0A248ZYM4_MANHA|nr:type II toxin-antitoxin system RelE/ParE family toxin [Mannheimia haemolytica]AWW70728.1 type II toxin-antitoxin system RelE/ParE family toxin [Pasteurellaceae bacterium 12565]AGK00555.1 plasmid stabilization system protein [Mannheimia haemolytica M42548]AGQ24410.1 hypothetical protein F382_05365 [Mannheimia haemolytica D153]AGQ39944.1 hypothetical protein J451_05605 [Mannheimia haemolytica D174]AGR73790.1 hypothetical protein N220_11505 [Mannheimia haemolytica USMARC_2286]
MPKSWELSLTARSNVIEILQSVEDYTGHWLSAVSLWEQLQNKLDLIAFMPTIGRRREDGTLETFCRNYRIVYEIHLEKVYIITIIHSRRLYPRPS